MTSPKKTNSVLIPIIRKMMPGIIAQDIVGVQPMNGDKLGFMPFVIVENQNECVLYSGNHIAVDVKPNVSKWIEEQAPHLWKYAEETDGCHFSFTRYIIDEQLFTIMSLKWGG